MSNVRYWPRCAVCQYERKHKDFAYRLAKSTYFTSKGTESASEVLAAFGSPFGRSAFYQHMNRHRKKDKERAIAERELDGPKPEDLLTAVEGEVVTQTSHEKALQEIVAKGRAKLATGDMTVTITSLINASKALADIEKSTKDRRLEGIKTLFKGITKNEKPGLTEGQE